MQGRYGQPVAQSFTVITSITSLQKGIKKEIFKQRLKNLQAPLAFGSERTAWSPEFVLCLASVTSADVFLQGAEGGGERTERPEPSLEGQESQLGRMNGGDLRGGKAITNGMEVHKQRR